MKTDVDEDHGLAERAMKQQHDQGCYRRATKLWRFAWRAGAAPGAGGSRCSAVCAAGAVGVAGQAHRAAVGAARHALLDWRRLDG